MLVETVVMVLLVAEAAEVLATELGGGAIVDAVVVDAVAETVVGAGGCSSGDISGVNWRQSFDAVMEIVVGAAGAQGAEVGSGACEGGGGELFLVVSLGGRVDAIHFAPGN